MASVGDIDTLVVVMLENRSFDHVFGHLRHPQYGNRGDIDGLVDPQTTTRYDNFYQNQVYKPFAMDDGPFPHDLPHTRSSIATQLRIITGQATMKGFVEAYVERNQSLDVNPPPMAFLKPAGLPVSGFLAAEYGVCNRWFAPLPAGTQPNRAMAFAGETLIDENARFLIPNHGLVLDWLEDKGVNWRVYYSGLSFFLLFNSPFVTNPDKFRNLKVLARDLDPQNPDNKAGKRPQVIFIEPEYDDTPVHFGATPNDNHPPLAMGPGEMFLHGIYTALTSDPDRWKKTLLVVTYDEHGGFFDHVEPLPIGYASPPGARFTEAFKTTGVRVPTLLASPLIGRGVAINATFDHTSILQFLAEKFAGGPENYSAQVTERRKAGIASLSAALTAQAARHDLPLPPAHPIVATSVVRGGEKQPLTDHQVAFAAAARQLMQENRPGALAQFPELALLRNA